MSRRKAPAPLEIPSTLTDAQRDLIAGADNDATRAVLISLFERTKKT